MKSFAPTFQLRNGTVVVHLMKIADESFGRPRSPFLVLSFLCVSMVVRTHTSRLCFCDFL
jgi:hypothetical protein